MTRASWAILAAVWLAGCAPFTVAGGKVAVSSQGFEVDLPQGWTPSAYWAAPAVHAQIGYAFPFLAPGDPERRVLLLTRDGFELQGISVNRSAIEGNLDHTRKDFVAGMSPEEATAIEVDNLRAGPRLLNLDLLENAPATVAGKAGFRLVYTWKTSSGLRMKGVEYGIVDGQWVYRLNYHGMARHYFDRDLPTFETLVGSFRLLDRRGRRGPVATSPG